MASTPRPYVAPAQSTPVPVETAPVAARAGPALEPVSWVPVSRVELGAAPALVWIGQGTLPDEVALERFAFGVPKTNIGSHAFRRLRISAYDAAQDPLVKAWAGTPGPTLVALSADGKSSKAVGAAEMAPKPVWIAMKEVAAANFNDDLEMVVAQARLNLEETERLEAQRRELSLSQVAEADRQARMAAIVQRMTELGSQLLSLYTLHLRKAA